MKLIHNMTIRGHSLGQISVFQVKGLKISDRVGIHYYVNFFFRLKCLLKCIKLFFFSRKPEKILCFTSKFRLGWVTLEFNTGVFLFGLIMAK